MMWHGSVRLFPNIRIGRAAIAAGLIVCGATAATAQSSAPDSSAASGDSIVAPRHAAWVTRNEALAFGAATVATISLGPFDHPISNEFIEPGWERRRRLHQVASDVAFFGGDGPFVMSAAILAGTELTGPVGLRRFAAHNVEAIALATILAGIGKGISGRALPGVRTKHAFELGRGFHDSNGPFVSFPSGHTAAAFAMAATIAGEVERSDSAHARLVDWLAYGGATAVGVARVAQRMHWPSDLPMAAFIGTWSGRVIQRHAGDAGPLGAILHGLTLGVGPTGATEFGWSSLASGDRPR